jgi:two-component system, LytTR family, response regulator
MICLIVDDDEFSRAVLEAYVQRTEGLVAVPSCARGGEAAAVLARQQIDLLLLDVEMPELSGLDLLSSLTDLPAVVLVSGSESYAVAAYEYAVLDYLVKPISYPRFMKAVQRARQRHAPTSRPLAAEVEGRFVFLKTGKRLLKVALDDIVRVEARRDYAAVYIIGERQVLVHTTMTSLEAFLPLAEFVRIHRSHIVRLDRINDIESSLVTIGRTVLPLGAAYRSALEARIRQP